MPTKEPEVKLTVKNVLDMPIAQWSKRILKANGQIEKPAVGGQIWANALNRRHALLEIKDRIIQLPQAMLNYSEDELQACGGLIQEMREIAVMAASIGTSRVDVAKLLGVTLARLQTWIEMGEAEGFPFNIFSQAYLRAEALAMMEDESDLNEAIALESKAASTRLAAIKRKDELTVKQGGTFDELPLSDFTNEEFDAYQAKGTIPERFKNYRRDKGRSDADAAKQTAYILELERKLEELKREKEKTNNDSRSPDQL